MTHCPRCGSTTPDSGSHECLDEFRMLPEPATALMDPDYEALLTEFDGLMALLNARRWRTDEECQATFARLKAIDAELDVLQAVRTWND